VLKTDSFFREIVLAFISFYLDFLDVMVDKKTIHQVYVKDVKALKGFETITEVFSNWRALG
jgi:hypothetical protein